MGPQIDFYISKDASPQNSLRTVCRLAEKGFHAGHIVHICTRNEKESEILDSLLWTFQDRSFVPHEIYRSKEPDCPVTISTENSPMSADFLINLTYQTPKNLEQFQRIAEIIDKQDESIHAGRERYRFYREQGLEPKHHEVS